MIKIFGFEWQWLLKLYFLLNATLLPILYVYSDVESAIDCLLLIIFIIFWITVLWGAFIWEWKKKK